MSLKRYELDIEAATEHLPQVTGFIEQHLSSVKASPKACMQILIAVEEIFVNIASYAYAPETGRVNITLELSGEPPEAGITFMDRGISYNPLSREDPDVGLSAEEREIGGLGIYMTRQFMDEVSYAYMDGQNVLTLRKRL